MYHLDDLAETVRREGAEIGNFAPVTLETPAGVSLRYEDMAIELETLSYELTAGRPAV